MRRALGMLVVAALAGIAFAAPASAAARRCHPGAHVLARRAGVVLWSVRHRSGRKVRIRVYACKSSLGRSELVASGGPKLAPQVKHLAVEGDHAVFFLVIHQAPWVGRPAAFYVFDVKHAHADVKNFPVDEIESAGQFVSFSPYGLSGRSLVVFDVKDLRREFTTTPSAASQVYPETFGYLLAPSGWIAEYFAVGASPADPFFQEQYILVATGDGNTFYTVDLVGLGHGLPNLQGDTLSWNSAFGGSASVDLGPGLIPAASPQQLTACQLVTAADVSPLLGQTSSSTSPGGCTYTSSFISGMTLTVTLQTGLTSTQEAADESALTSSGWDGLLSEFGGFLEYTNAVTTGGVPHQQLDAFYGGAELSFDVSVPNEPQYDQQPAEFTAWLGEIGLDRLFSVPVTRAS